MLRITAGLAVVVLLAAPMFQGESAVSAKEPAYLVYRAPVFQARRHSRRVYHPSRQIDVQRHAYAYGWFGVRPRRHWGRHSGYYGNYTQWTAQ